MPTERPRGIALSRALFDDLVRPLLARRLPDDVYSAARVGTGSDVLGLDDDMSTDHDWGLRLTLFAAADRIAAIEEALEAGLPATFRGLPLRYAFSGDARERLHIDVTTVAAFADAHLGFDPRGAILVDDWLSLTGQAALEVTAGAVFVDADGELTRLRRALEWYPDDIWRYVLACDWARLAQELPLAGRAADAGDELGSRIIAARLGQIVMHLTFLLARRWPPYAKWLGSLWAELPGAQDLRPHLHAAVAGADAAVRQRGLVAALDVLLARQDALGLTSVEAATVAFWDRPFRHPAPAISEQLLDGIGDPAVRALTLGLGSIEQRTDNVDVLTEPRRRRVSV